MQNFNDAFDVFHSVAMIHADLRILTAGHKIRQFFLWDLPHVGVDCVVDCHALNKQDFAVSAALEFNRHSVI